MSACLQRGFLMAVEQFDLVVLGSGQGGNPLATAFAAAGRTVAMIEREHVGGTCVNEGCTPTKTMIASARVAHLARRAADFGMHVEGPRIDLRMVRQRKREIVRSFREGGVRGLEEAGVTLVCGTGRFIGPRLLEATTDDGVRRIRGGTVVINTGATAARPKVRGLDAVPCLDSTSIMELGELPEHLIVLGAGSVGLEFGQMFRRFGAAVTVLERGPQLLGGEDPDVSEALAGMLLDEGIAIHLDTTVASVSGGLGAVEAEIESGGRRSTIAGTHLLVAAGRRPATASLDLQAAGVRTTRRGFIRVNSRLETSAEATFAIGDVNGGPAFTHVSYDDYRILRTNLLEGGKAGTRGRQVPYVVFTDPQLGRIGLTEREARDKGKTIRVTTMSMSRVARALETGETSGLMKAVVDAKTDRLLGAAILGTEGGETAAMLQVAMLGRLKWQALRDGIFAHPTWSEAVNNLFGTLESEKATTRER